PDVLLSDIGMPGETGYDLIRRVRALPAEGGGQVPAAALTAYTRAGDRQKVRAPGVALHGATPVEPAALITTVATAPPVRRAPAEGGKGGRRDAERASPRGDPRCATWAPLGFGAEGALVATRSPKLNQGLPHHFFGFALRYSIVLATPSLVRTSGFHPRLLI